MAKRKKTGINWGKTALGSINICLARAQNIQVKVLEQIYNSLIESRMMTGRNLGIRRGMGRNRGSSGDVL
jgi:hypothetical protein